MRSALIFNADDVSVISYGNGLAYAVTDERTGRTELYQGDDAADFRIAWRLAEERLPQAPIADLLRDLVTEGSTAATA